MKTQNLRHEMEVVYVPHHADGDPDHPDAERGIVSSWREEKDARTAGTAATVWVRYGGMMHAKATRIEDLIDPKASYRQTTPTPGVEPGESL